MSGVARGNLVCAKAQLPGNEDAAYPIDLHTLDTHVPSGKRTACSHNRLQRLRIARLGLAVVTQHRLAVLVLLLGTGMVLGGVEFSAVIRQP
jgi:hypothetical protein